MQGGPSASARQFGQTASGPDFSHFKQESGGTSNRVMPHTGANFATRDKLTRVMANEGPNWTGPGSMIDFQGGSPLAGK